MPHGKLHIVHGRCSIHAWCIAAAMGVHVVQAFIHKRVKPVPPTIKPMENRVKPVKPNRETVLDFNYLFIIWVLLVLHVSPLVLG